MDLEINSISSYLNKIHQPIFLLSFFLYINKLLIYKILSEKSIYSKLIYKNKSVL